MSEEYASLATPDSCPAPPIPSHRVHNALTPLNGTILGQSKTRRSHGLRKTPGHQVNAVLVPVVPSPDLRELSGRGRSLFHPVGQSEEEYPPTRVIDACRREPRPHQIPVPRRPQPESTALTTPNPRESRRSRLWPQGLSHHRPGRSWARRPGVRPMTLASMSEECLPRHTGFLSRATNLKPSRPPRLNALSSTLSPPSKRDSPDME
jgi:hypothetical protein